MAETAKAEPVHVLVIDDDPASCRLTELTLTKHGYRVSLCSDSAQALGLLKEDHYGCVLLDIRMKGLQGTELLPIIKHNFPTLPVIIVSAYCAHSDAGYYSSLGAFELVAKPFDGERLVDVVNRAVGSAETISLVLPTLSLSEARDQLYQKLLVSALRRANWNQIKAAQLLGISRYSLIRWLRKFQITY